MTLLRPQLRHWQVPGITSTTTLEAISMCFFFFVWFPLKLQQLHSLELFCKDNSCSVTPFSLKVPTNTCGDVEKEEPTLQLEG